MRFFMLHVDLEADPGADVSEEVSVMDPGVGVVTVTQRDRLPALLPRLLERAHRLDAGRVGCRRCNAVAPGWKGGRVSFVWARDERAQPEGDEDRPPGEVSSG